jgi:hypothetical protein
MLSCAGNGHEMGQGVPISGAIVVCGEHSTHISGIILPMPPERLCASAGASLWASMMRVAWE